MAYDGGIWLTQNKVLPGTFINFSSVSRASATLSDRGVAAAPFELDWGEQGVVKLVEQGDFQKNSFDIFGHGYTDDEMLALREIFRHATKVYCYRLIANDAVKAKCDFAAAKYPGTRGNDIRIAIEQILEKRPKENGQAGETESVVSGYTVTTYVGAKVVDEQTVSTEWSDLQNNDWVDFKAGCKFGTKPSDAAEDDTTVYVGTSSTGVKLTGGANGSVDGNAHQDFLDAIESYAFNALCCPVDEDATTKGLYVQFTKRVRDKIGSKFQLVGYDLGTPDHEGIINLKSTASGDGVSKAALTYWLTGAEAACNINESLTNTAYDGEIGVILKGISQTKAELEAATKKGELVFHNSNDKIVILSDINSLVTLKEDFGAAFRQNQVIRVCDQIANDITVLFTNRYLGIVQNDATGRASLWNDIVCYLREMQRLRAVENLDPEKVTVERGNEKRSVLITVSDLNVTVAMEQLYMAVVIE